MKTRAERRNSRKKEQENRIKLCKELFGYENCETEYITRKTDIPHSHGSNYWNAYETKSMQNKQQRLKDKNNLKKEIESEY